MRLDLDDVQEIFQRAFTFSFTKKKCLAIFSVLLACGLLVVFCRGLAFSASSWIALSLTFLPIFFCAGLLLAAGVVLIRVYHDEIKKRKLSYRAIFTNSLDVLIGTSYLSVPIILAYLILWMLLGIFFLLSEIPGLGNFFSLILAFAPFLLNFGSLLLCVLSLSLLYFVTPVIALRKMNRLQLIHTVTERLQSNLFLNIFLATIAALPLLLLCGLLVIAAYMTGEITYTTENPAYVTLEWFFVMIPFTAILAPAVIFFFNFSAESYVLLQRRAKQ